GIRLENRRNIIVRNLKIEKFATGIYLWNSSGITITGNTISNNGDGIYLWNSSGNRVFLNNFIGNVRQVYSLGSVNVWDDGFRGNYWSDYRGEDRNNDGIGDTPYTIDEKNVDRYPLIHPYGYLPVKVTSLYGTTSGEGWYEKGSTATISVSPVLIDHGNGTRRVFSGWYDEKGNFLSSEPVFSLTVDKPFSITARWDTEYRVEAYSPYGSVTGSNWYKRGSTVTISVSPTVVEGFFTRHVFEGWIAEGRLISTTPTYSFTVDKPVTLIASWKTEINLPAALSLAALLLLIILFRQRLAPRKITEMQKLRLENEQLKRELQTVLNQRAQLQQVLNKLQLENEQLKRIINPPRAQIVELYNELVERVLRERDYVDTTILDKLLMEAQHSVERGDLSYARYLLEVVKNMINDNEVLVRLRRLYQIGIKSGYTPTIL
ncbi:MAG: NosD domain-containing protein, partial [Thermofilaceae archaeon]